MKIKSDFAILDVKSRRAALNKHFKNRPRLGKCPANLRIPVVLAGYIDGVNSDDDGVFREFSITVKSVSVVK